MKRFISLARIGCLTMALFGLLVLAGCAQKSVTYQLDLVKLVQEERIPRQELDTIAYQVRESIESKVRKTLNQDALAYWVNAEMVDMCGIIILEDKPAAGGQGGATTEIVSVKVLITYQSYSMSADTMLLQLVSADVAYEDSQWEVKTAEVMSESSPAVDLKLDDHDVYCISYF